MRHCRHRKKCTRQLYKNRAHFLENQDSAQLEIEVGRNSTQMKNVAQQWNLSQQAAFQLLTSSCQTSCQAFHKDTHIRKQDTEQTHIFQELSYESHKAIILHKRTSEKRDLQRLVQSTVLFISWPVSRSRVVVRVHCIPAS